MPLYEYACIECGNRFELLRGAGQADGPTICDRCSGTRVKRLLSVFAAPRGTSESYDSAPTSYGGGGCACGGACSCNN
jgi:putative FmdB family regulatory protein